MIWVCDFRFDLCFGTEISFEICPSLVHKLLNFAEFRVAAAYFSSLLAWKPASGTYLPGNVLDAVYVQTLTECLEHCAQRCPRCGSVNLAVGSGTAGGQLGEWRKCELNVEFGNSSTLSNDDGWEFYNVDVTRCR